MPLPGADRGTGETARPARVTPGPLRRAAAAMLVTGLVAGLVSSQGGYFPSSWGWASIASLGAIVVWIVASGRSDARALDAAFLLCLGLLVAWIGASVAWSVAPAQSVLEVERALVPLTGVAAVLALARRRDLTLLTCAALTGIVGVALYALGTRLLPGELETFDPVAVYRLASPIGYWNGLGVFCAMGILVAVGLAAEAGSDWVRAVAAAVVVPLATTLYFTFSRGSWITLALGAALVVLCSPSRLRLLLTGFIAAIPATVAVAAASSSSALTHREADLGAAAADGRRLIVLLAGLAAAAAGLVLVVAAIERRWVPSRRVTLGFDGLLVLACAVVAVAALVRLGGPLDAADRAWSAFSAPPVETSVDLDERLFSLSNNGRLELWRAAWEMHEDDRAIGAGAGTFERQWERRDDARQRVRDAHGLYVETLAELGIVGFVLLCCALAAPLIATARVRCTALVPSLAGAYTVFLVHASVDWDWELAGVTLTALLLGSLLVVAARAGSVWRLSRGLRVVAALAAVALATAGGVGLLGHRALDRAQLALERGDGPSAVRHAARAQRLMPWSPAPWNARGRGELIGGDTAAATSSFRRAIEIDDGAWQSWLNLAVATTGRTRADALARARLLYPRGSEIAKVAAELAGDDP